jgi:hypothetical protein
MQQSYTYDATKLRGDPRKDEAFYNDFAYIAQQFGADKMFTSATCGYSPRAEHILAVSEGREFTPQLADFCPVNPDLNPVWAKKWMKKHTLSQFCRPVEYTEADQVAAESAGRGTVEEESTPQSAPEEPTRTKKTEANRKKRERRKRAQQNVQPAEHWKSVWQRCIRRVLLVVKQNRASRVQTAMNRVDSRRHELHREKCNKVKATKPERPYTRPGPSGPLKHPAHVAETASLSTTSKRDGKKAIGHEQCQLHEQKLEDKEKLRISQKIKQAESRRKAFEIGGS